MRKANQIQPFREFVDECELMEFKSSTTHYTWSNRRWSGGLVRKCIDKAFSTVDWNRLYPDANVLYLPANGSDHSPLVISANPPIPTGRRLFQYNAAWKSLPDCEETVRNGWTGGGHRPPMKLFFYRTRRVRHYKKNYF